MDNLSTPFTIACSVENTACYERFEKGQSERYIVGRASGKMVDHDHERVAESALLSIQKAIENGIIDDDGELVPVPLMSEHRKGWDDELGYLTKAWIDENWDLWIEAKLDPDSPNAHYLYTRLTKSKPKKHGLSVGGFILEAGEEWNEDLHKTIRVFHDVGLNEVSVTSQPAYPTAYLNALQKSVKWDKLNASAGRQVVATEEIMKSFGRMRNTMDENTNTENIEKNEAVEEVADEVTKNTADESVDENVTEKSEAADEAAEDVVEKSEAESDEESVEKAADETTTDETVEKAHAEVTLSAYAHGDASEDPLQVLMQAVTALREEVNALKGGDVAKSTSDASDEETVEKSAASETEDEAVEKTASDTESADAVEKSSTASNDDVLAKALASTLDSVLDEKLTPLAELMKGFEKRMETIESQEVDGSLSVSKAIGNSPREDENEDFEKSLNAEMEGMSSHERIAHLLKRQRGLED